jgi:hypothetical protein
VLFGRREIELEVRVVVVDDGGEILEASVVVVARARVLRPSSNICRDVRFTTASHGAADRAAAGAGERPNAE